MADTVPFSELGDGDQFVIDDPRVIDTPLTKVVTKPFGNECAVTDTFALLLPKPDTPCILIIMEARNG